MASKMNRLTFKDRFAVAEWVKSLAKEHHDVRYDDIARKASVAFKLTVTRANIIEMYRQLELPHNDNGGGGMHNLRGQQFKRMKAQVRTLREAVVHVLEILAEREDIDLEDCARWIDAIQKSDGVADPPEES